MKKNGYRLHWENSIETPAHFGTMREVKAAIKRAARNCGITIKQATKFAHVITEEAYQAERRERRTQSK